MREEPFHVVAESPLFCVDWYTTTYPDVELSGMDPARHYLHVGAPLGRDPGPDFSTSFYIESNADVREAGHNPLWHYELIGRKEGRRIAPALPRKDTRDAKRVASEIDRTRASIDPTEARDALKEILSKKLEALPDRVLSDFDPDIARHTVDCLGALCSEEKIARKRLASVIMPTYNRAAEIPAAIHSVLSQSHQALELIVVDDGSTDGTSEVLASVNDPRLRTFRIGRSGVSRARNFGLAEAQGDVIFYLDSDNVWTRDFVRLMLISLTVSDARCAYSALSVVDKSGTQLYYRGEPFCRAACLDGNYVDLNVFCHERELFERFGGFDPKLRRMVDWDLILRYTRDTKPIFIPFIGCYYTENKGDGLRISNSQPFLFEKIVKEMNIGDAIDAEEALNRLRLNVAIRVGARDCEAASALAEEFTAEGHSVRIDTPETWTVRQPYEDDVILLCDGAAESPRDPQQITLLCPIDEWPAGSRVQSTIIAVRERLFH